MDPIVRSSNYTEGQVYRQSESQVINSHGQPNVTLNKGGQVTRISHNEHTNGIHSGLNLQHGETITRGGTTGSRVYYNNQN